MPLVLGRSASVLDEERDRMPPQAVTALLGHTRHQAAAVERRCEADGRRHGRGVASEYWAKFYLVADAIRMNRTDGALVRFITRMRPEESVADARRRTFELAAVVSPRLQEHIPER